MAKYQTHKATAEGKAETLHRRSIRGAKYATSALQIA